VESERVNIWLQIAGMIGIIASLIFVGLQLKQSQDIAIAGQYAERASESTENWRFVAEHPVLLSNIGREHREHLKGTNYYDDEYTDQQIGVLYAHARNVIASWDNNYYQYVSGFMTEEAWSMYANRVRRGCSQNGTMGAVVRNHPELLRRSFVEICLQAAKE
jgi:hypothetical protein